MRYRLLRTLTLACFCFVPQPGEAIEIGPGGGISGAYGLAEEESRFLPGVYFFNKGSAAFARGKTGDAIAHWTLAASWGNKSAQYNLGIMYYKGLKVGQDIPLGLAWLGLAAERHQPSFQDSFDAAWYQASVEDRIEAKGRHKELKSKYGDKIALQRARRRFEEEKRNITGSRVGAVGNLTVYSAGSSVGMNGARYLDEIQQKADDYFDGSAGSVNVGDLIPLDAGSTSSDVP